MYVPVHSFLFGYIKSYFVKVKFILSSFFMPYKNGLTDDTIYTKMCFYHWAYSQGSKFKQTRCTTLTGEKNYLEW